MPIIVAPAGILKPKFVASKNDVALSFTPYEALAPSSEVIFSGVVHPLPAPVPVGFGPTQMIDPGEGLIEGETELDIEVLGETLADGEILGEAETDLDGDKLTLLETEVLGLTDDDGDADTDEDGELKTSQAKTARSSMTSSMVTDVIILWIYT